MNPYSVLFLGFILFIAGLLPHASSAAGTSENVQLLAEHEISQDSLESKINGLNSRTDLDEKLKNKLLNFYRNANENLRNDEWFQFLAKSYQASIEQSAAQIKAQQSKIDQFQTQSPKNTELLDALSTEELQQRLILEKTELNNLETQTAKIENELTIQETRAAEIRQETETTKQALDDSDKNAEVFKLFAETELERDARQLQLTTLQNKLTSQLKTLGLEAISHPGRVDLLKTQLQWLTLQKQVLLPVISELEKKLIQHQQQEARNLKNKLLEVEQKSLNKHPAIQLITKENINYSLDLQTLSAKLEKNNQEKDLLDAQTQEIDNDFKSAEKKISLAGLSPVLGKILRDQRYKLTAIHHVNQQTKIIQTETALTSLAEFKLENRLKQLADIDAELKNLLTSQSPQLIDTKRRAEDEAELRLLLNEQKDLLNKLAKLDASYLRSLGDYDFAKQQLLKQAAKYALYLDERLLWVPSSAAIDKAYFVNLYDATKWLLSPLNWKDLLLNLLNSLLENFFLTLLALLILAGFMRFQSKIQQQLADLNGKIGVIYNEQFHFTLLALGYTAVIILPLPLALWFLGWVLENGGIAADFSLAVAKGLQNSAFPSFFLQLFYQLFAPAGFTERHFNWQARTTALLHQQIGWIRKIIIPAIFLMAMANAAKNPLYSDSLGRLALVVIMIVMMVALARLLNPDSGILQAIIKNRPDSWVTRLRYAWYASVMAAPLVVIGFALAGYYLSALELEQKLIMTLRLCFVMVILHELVLRWLTLVDRQLAMENARQKRKVAQLSTKNPAAGDIEIQELALLDIPKINQQTIKLLNVGIGISLLLGIWIIWKTILPAFSFLEQIVLWQHVMVVDKSEVLQAITLSNLLLAGIYLFVTMIAVNNFPGLMEVLILRRFSFELGSRYAINQLTRYFLTAMGLVFIVNELGGSWSQVQWLVAALSVGLGFGLQEIFANLVSGIILLFERPIRVGDTVTVGDVSGKVSQIQMRATRIVDWDQKELIVPNKIFITDKLINWALSSQVTRIVIPLSIAYGSDVELAHRVISETVCNTPLVLSEPPPDIYFLGFGDSALEFSIRVHVNELGHRLPVTHELHLRLYKTLAENKIEIPFPQRDIHIRSMVKNED
jgi:potassium-dependent mechanosensitive channel